MHSHFVTTLLAGLFLLNAPALSAQEFQQWTPLFNGKDLTGWKTHPKQPGQWRVENGTLIGSGPTVSHLFTERGDFDSFHLRVEAKISAKGNSGVFFRSEYGLSNGMRYPAGYEAQICMPDTKDPRLTGSLIGFADVREQLIKPEQWFTLEVTGDGRFLTIKINGKTAVHFKDEKYTYKKGHFALQQMAGTTVAFRRIDVLEPCPAQFAVRENVETVPLFSYWHGGRQDNVTLSSKANRDSLEKQGYEFSRIQARILKEAKKGTAPLLLYQRGDGKEYLTVSSDAGQKTSKSEGYKLVGVQGYVYKDPRPGTIPLPLYWSAERKDYFTTGCQISKQACLDANYQFVRNEGYAFDAWRNQPKPWAVILCKFRDTADYEPHPVRFYEEAFTAAGKGKGREFDYFRDVSGGRLDMTGSRVFGWYTLANHSTAELKTKNKRVILHGWAVEAARAKGVDLKQFFGVMVMFNHPTDVGAQGTFGGPMLVVVSYNKKDWNPNLNCHELGHGFGLDHARLIRPLTEYGDGWDVMGSYYNFRVKTKYGDAGPGLNALHLSQLGCISPDRIWTANPHPGSQTITLASVNQFDADGFLMATIPPASASKISHVVDFRRKQRWDGGIPRDTVLVYEDRKDWASWLLSRNNSADLDTIQVSPGQTFEVPERDLTVKVESFDAKTSTAKVTIKIGQPGELSHKLKQEKKYLIVNVQSGRVLDATEGLGDDGTEVRLFGKNAKDTPQRLWHIVDAGNGAVMIVNVASGRLLDAHLDTIKKDGTKIGLYGTDAKNMPNRLWKKVDVGKGEIAIVNVMSGRVLDADSGTIDKDGTKVTLFGKNADGKPNRRWKLVPVARWPRTGPNLLVNGSFEDGPAFGDKDDWFELLDGSEAIKGWKVTGSLLITGKLWEHADGNNSLLLHSPKHRGGIAQTFPTQKGQRYRVSFALSANPNNGRWTPEQTATAIRVSAAGQARRFTFDCAGKLPANMGWILRTWEFVATADRTTLAFTTDESNKGFWHGPALDDVWVEAVP